MKQREAIVETVNKLVIYTDERLQQKLQHEVFTNEVHLDMVSLGGKATDTTALSICKQWEDGFTGIDYINDL
jgi:helix-turn-helix protein